MSKRELFCPKLKGKSNRELMNIGILFYNLKVIQFFYFSIYNMQDKITAFVEIKWRNTTNLEKKANN